MMPTVSEHLGAPERATDPAPGYCPEQAGSHQASATTMGVTIMEPWPPPSRASRNAYHDEGR
jgi:hypothetical protein